MILDELQKIECDIIKWRRDLHKIPELGLDLLKTVDYVTHRLDEFGVFYKTMVDGNGVVALIQGDFPGKTLAIRGDMDGLPIKEETDFEFKSINSNMHACGHDGHTAMLLGAVKILSQKKHLIHGNVKFIFQPGEEYPGGAKPMIDEGVLENPKVDGVIGLHQGIINPEVPHGMIGVSFGQTMACMDRFKVTIDGAGGHGAYPELTTDPISIANQVMDGIYRIKSREIKASTPVVISICQVHGGFNQNIIPDSVFFEGTARSTDPITREFIAKRITDISHGIASSMGAKATVEFDFKYPPLVNDRDFTQQFVKSAEKIIGSENIYTLDKPIMGGEDFAFFSERVPGTYFFLSNGLAVDGIIHPHHSSKFAVDESYFKIGSAIFVQYALDYLK